MMITKIEQQKKNSTRRSIFINGSYSFSASMDVFVQFALYEGKQLTEAEIATIEHAEKKSSVNASALRYRSYKPRSTHEVIMHLTKKGFDGNLIDVAIHTLQINNLLNDTEYARMICRDTLTLKPVGKIALMQRLIKKGISKDTANTIINEFYTADVEKELALKEAEKKYKRIASLPSLIIKRRIFNHLMRRGYNASLSQSIINHIIK